MENNNQTAENMAHNEAEVINDAANEQVETIVKELSPLEKLEQEVAELKDDKLDRKSVV